MTFHARPREKDQTRRTRRLRRTRISIDEKVSWPSRLSRPSCLVFRRPPGGFKAHTQTRGLIACAAVLALSVACGGGGGEPGARTDAAPAASVGNAYLEMAKEYIAQVTAPGAPWTGPTTGPTAQSRKLVVYVS